MKAPLLVELAEGSEYHRQTGGVQSVTEHHRHGAFRLFQLHVTKHLAVVCPVPFPLVGSELHLRRVLLQEAVHLQHPSAEVEEDFVPGPPDTAGRHQPELRFLLRQINKVAAICPVLRRGAELIELAGCARSTEGHLGTIHHVLLFVGLEVGAEHLVMETGTHQVVEASVLGSHGGAQGVHFAHVEQHTVGTGAHDLDEVGARHVGRHHQLLLPHGFGTQVHVGLALLLQGTVALLLPKHQVLVVLLLTAGILFAQHPVDGITQTGGMCQDTLSAGRGGDDAQEKVRIDHSVVVHHPYPRHAGAQIDHHAQKEHVALTEVLRYLQPFGEDGGKPLENPVGQEGSREAHLAVACNGFFQRIRRLFSPCGGFTWTFWTHEPEIRLGLQAVQLRKAVSIRQVTADFGSVAVGHGEVRNGQRNQLLELGFVHACTACLTSQGQLEIVPVGTHIRVLFDEAVEELRHQSLGGASRSFRRSGSVRLSRFRRLSRFFRSCLFRQKVGHLLPPREYLALPFTAEGIGVPGCVAGAAQVLAVHVHGGIEQPTEGARHDEIGQGLVLLQCGSIHPDDNLDAIARNAYPRCHDPRQGFHLLQQQADVARILVNVYHQIAAEGADILLGVSALAHTGNDDGGHLGLDAFGFLQLTLGLQAAAALHRLSPTVGTDSGYKLCKRDDLVLLALYIRIIGTFS